MKSENSLKQKHKNIYQYSFFDHLVRSNDGLNSKHKTLQTISMKLYEFEGKQLFRNMGIPVPEGDVVSNVDEAKKVADRLGYPIVLKSQVLSGGRGKAGGIQFAGSESELENKATELLGTTISNEVVQKLLVEKKTDKRKEYYAGITLDPRESLPLLMVSAKGGIDVEEVAENMPDQLHSMPLDPMRNIELYHLLEVVSKTGSTGKELVQISRVLQRLVACYYRFDAFTVEINPLLVGSKAEVFAADAKVEIDDSALFRLPDVKAFERPNDGQTSLEKEARKAGLAYITMDDGNVGIISSGAGLAMSSMDMIQMHGGKPANFLDLGGGASPEKAATALKIVLKTPGVEGVLFNVFGGANNCEQMAKGIVQVVDELNPTQTIMVKMRGYSQDEGWKLLEDRNVPIVKYGTTEEAVETMLSQMRKKDQAR